MLRLVGLIGVLWSASIASSRQPNIVMILADDVGREVLAYFQYDPEDLFDRMFQDCETAVREGRLTVNESRSLLSFYRSGLNGYTYLEGEEA